MNFLTEHKIEQYADLVSRIEDVNAENEKTADALKGVEKRLADMAVLMKHVTTYQKTKTVYVLFDNVVFLDLFFQLAIISVKGFFLRLLFPVFFLHGG